MTRKPDAVSGGHNQSGWINSTIEGVAEAVSTGPFGSLLHKHDYISGGVPIINPVNLVDGLIQHNKDVTVSEETAKRLSAYCLRPGDILVGRRGDIGRCALVSDSNDGSLCGTGCFFIRPSQAVEPQFLALLLGSPEYRKRLQAASTGTTMLNLSNNTLSKLAVRIPPLEEQKRIVAVLDQAFTALDRARAHAEANLADAAILFETSLDDVMTTHSTAGEKTKLGSVCAFENGDRGVNYPGRKAFVPDGIPFINAGHLDRGSIDWEGMNFIPEAHFHRISKGKVKKGDLLFCLRGSLGKFGHVDREGLGAIASSLVIVRAGNALLTDYLQMYFKSKGCRQMIDRYAGGAAQPNLSAGDLKKFEIIVPSLDRQTVAVEKHDRLLDATLKLGNAYTMQLEYLANLRQSLLQKAFSGQLT